MRRLTPLAVLLVGLGGSTAHAAACCLSSSAFGLGRLASWERSAVLLGFSTSPVLGRWDSGSVWRPNEVGIAENEWRWNLSAIIALHDRIQVSGRVPVVLTTRDILDQHAAGGGLGDMQLAARFEPVFQGEYPFLPEIAINVGATLPSGRVADGLAPAELLGTEVTGRGAWVLSASLTAELARAIWFVQVGGGVTVPLPMTAPDGSQQIFGVGVQATLAGGVEVTKGVVVSAVARFSWEGPLRTQPRDEATGLPTTGALVVLPGSQQYDFGIGPNLSYKLSQNWTLQGGADFSIPGTGMGANRQGRITANLGVRFAVL